MFRAAVQLDAQGCGHASVFRSAVRLREDIGHHGVGWNERHLELASMDRLAEAVKNEFECTWRGW